MSGVQQGLTMVVGPPGTGKTDTAVQIMHVLYHNQPEQRTLLITHSNQVRPFCDPQGASSASGGLRSQVSGLRSHKRQAFYFCMDNGVYKIWRLPYTYDFGRSRPPKKHCTVLTFLQVALVSGKTYFFCISPFWGFSARHLQRWLALSLSTSPLPEFAGTE